MSVDSPSRWPDDLVGTLKEFDRRLRALESSNRLTSASIGSGGLTVRSGGDVTILEGGNLQLESNGVLEVHNLAEPSRGGTTETGFVVSTTMATKAEASLIVPAWALNAAVFYGANVTVNNGSAAEDVLWFKTEWTDGVNTFPGQTYQQSTGSGDWVAVHLSDTITQGVADVSTLKIRIQVRSRDSAWGSNGSNVANIQGLVVWWGFGA